MSELKATTVYDAYWTANSTGQGTGVLVYLKSEADKEIAELKQKLEDAGMRERRLKRALWLARAAQAYSKQYWGSYVEYVHLHENSFYQFINDDIFRRDNPNNDSFRKWSHRWRSVEIKCLKKAEEYK